MKNILLLLLAGLLSCKSAKDKTSQEVNLDNIATNVLLEKFERSDKGDYALFYTIQKTPGVLIRDVLVLSKVSGEVVYGPKRLNANVSWHEENILKIEEFVGVVENPNEKDKGPHYYNILTQKKSFNLE